MAFSPGVNVLVGANGTGKTHVMKVCYAACDVSKPGSLAFPEKLVRVFLPSRNAPGRLVKRQQGSSSGTVAVSQASSTIRTSFTNHTWTPRSAVVKGMREWTSIPIEGVYIPVKEMLSHAPGFQSLYAERDIHFEEIYNDIINRAFKPLLRGPLDRDRSQLQSSLQKAIDGKVRTSNQEFFLRNRQGNLEFTLLAEGMRKLGLLWLLIQNGTLLDGSVLFWDEPETNLNPSLFGVVVDVLLKLQRLGVQIFLATHSYVLLKEIDLRKEDADYVMFHAFYRTGNDDIACNTTEDYLSIDPNAIAEAFESLYDREIERSVKSIRDTEGIEG